MQRKGIYNFVSLKHNLIEKSAVGLIYFRLVFPNPLLICSEKMCKSGEYFLINSLSIEHAMNLRSTSYSTTPAVQQSTSQEFEGSMSSIYLNVQVEVSIQQVTHCRATRGVISHSPITQPYDWGAWEPMCTCSLRSHCIHRRLVTKIYLQPIISFKKHPRRQSVQFGGFIKLNALYFETRSQANDKLTS